MLVLRPSPPLLSDRDFLTIMIRLCFAFGILPVHTLYSADARRRTVWGLQARVGELQSQLRRDRRNARVFAHETSRRHNEHFASLYAQMEDLRRTVRHQAMSQVALVWFGWGGVG